MDEANTSETKKPSLNWTILVVSSKFGFPQGAPVNQEAQKPANLSFFKILVAEDNAVNQILLSKMLQRLQIQFKIVGDGSEVISSLMEERYDLVLMDCFMSPMDGFTTAEKIRGSAESFRNVPLLAFTASADQDIRKKCLNLGMNEVLLKPVTQAELAACLQTWADKIYAALPVLDDASIDKIRMFDDEEQTLVKSLLQIYSESTADELRQLKILIAEDNMEGARKKAHKLKSSAAQLGAMRFEKFCNLMEYEADLHRVRALALFEEMLSQYELSREKFEFRCQNSDQNKPASV
jgi:CheY-like chemotaxis protein/HPt (histidine-containing phosphotransfer) domain-containing protein